MSDYFRKLIQASNHADDWSLVTIVHVAGAAASQSPGLISGNTFRGKVTLLVHPGAQGRIVDNDIIDSTISTSATVQKSLVKRANILDAAKVYNSIVTGVAPEKLWDAGSVSAASSTAFGVGTPISLGCSIGGRNVKLSARMPFEDVADWITKHDDSAKKAFAQAVEHEVKAHQSFASIDETVRKHCIPFPCTIVRGDAILLSCNPVLCSHVRGRATVVDSTLHHSFVDGSVKAPTIVSGHSSVKSSIIHRGCVVDDGASVVSSMLCPGSGAKLHATLMQSVIGTGTVVSHAEVSNSFVGPFVGLHHSSLLISAVWPSGKGNIAYGANVGSNHTGKLPDQELFPGEGVFFGLGVCIKYPSNFDDAPYTLIASGVTTLPQKVSLPFSLINQQGAGAAAVPGVSPAINELMPGWMLSDNIYAVYRNQIKFLERSRSAFVALMEGEPRVFSVDWAILFRTDIAQHLSRGLALLQNAKRPVVDMKGGRIAADVEVPTNAVYLESQIPGMGKNYMTERSRKGGMKAFQRYLKLFALHHLFCAINGTDPWTERPVTKGKVNGSVWDIAKHHVAVPSSAVVADSTAAATLDMSFDWSSTLNEYISMLNQDVEAAKESKNRDTERGVRIIPDYKEVYSLVEDDTVIVQMQRVIQRARALVDKIAPSVSVGGAVGTLPLTTTRSKI